MEAQLFVRRALVAGLQPEVGAVVVAADAAAAVGEAVASEAAVGVVLATVVADGYGLAGGGGAGAVDRGALAAGVDPGQGACVGVVWVAAGVVAFFAVLVPSS